MSVILPFQELAAAHERSRDDEEENDERYAEQVEHDVRILSDIRRAPQANVDLESSGVRTVSRPRPFS
jgi:hypothetical protein